MHIIHTSLHKKEERYYQVDGVYYKLFTKILKYCHDFAFSTVLDEPV